MRFHRLAPILALLLTAFSIVLVGQEADPSKEEVLLEEREGWQTSLVFDAGCGVWCVKSFQLYPELAAPEIVAADDRGRATILISYSGKWTPKATILDGKWLAPMTQGDFAMGQGVLLLGGAGGRLYETRPRAEGHGDVLLRAEFPGEEIHTILTIPDRNGDGHDRALVFLKSGRVFEYRCPHETERRKGQREPFVVDEIERVEGRVRDALLWAYSATEDAAIVWTVSRAGQLVRRTLEVPQGRAIRMSNEVVLDEPQGLGRVSRGVGPFADCLYVSRDDGVYLRVKRDQEGAWSREVIHRGEQGPRGIVAGRFDEDPEVETLAIFGYSGKVELLSRRGDAAFAPKTLFIDRDKGHWLAKAELDGRNETEEIIASGYSGRVVLISRQRAGAHVPTDAAEDGDEAGDTGPVARPTGTAVVLRGSSTGPRRAPWRIGVRKLPAARDIDPLRYGGGFYTKTATYLTLVRRDALGKLVPGLARSWSWADAGRTWTFKLDTEHRMQDGGTLDSAVVARQYRSIREDRAHAWLGFARHLETIETPDPTTLVIRLDRPWAIEEELVAVNPFGVRAWKSHDEDGRFRAPLGSGPLRPRVEDQTVGGLVYVDRGGRPVFELVLVPEEKSFRKAVIDGEVDLVVHGWDADLWAELAESEVGVDDGLPRFEGPGSSLVYLSFNLERAPGGSLAWRRALAAGIDRRKFGDEASGMGPADGAETWSMLWAKIPDPSGESAVAAPSEQLLPMEGRWTLLVNSSEDWQGIAAAALVRALDLSRTQGLEIKTLPGAEYEKARLDGDFDVLIERTWGLPYDPFLSLVGRFDPPGTSTASRQPRSGIDPALRAAVQEMAAMPGRSRRVRAMQEIQRMLTERALVVPLYLPRRIALMGHRGDASLEAPLLGPDPYSLPVEALTRAIESR